MRRIRISIAFDSSRDKNVVVKSLEPEIGKEIPRTRIKLEHDNKEMTLTIYAEDISSLRAACNSYLRWIDTAVNVMRCCRNQ